MNNLDEAQNLLKEGETSCHIKHQAGPGAQFSGWVIA
jgi:hypothetical protein